MKTRTTPLKNLQHATTVLALITLAACSDSNNTPVEENVALNFAAKVGSDDFVCGTTYNNVGIGLDDWQVTDFRLFVHEVHLHDIASGDEYEVELDQSSPWQHEHVALLDFEDGCGAGTPDMNKQVTGTISVPAGQTLDVSHVEACFVLGVPESMNHLDPATAPSPLNSSGMLWAWKTGMKYIRIDGVDPNGTAPNNKYNLHLGAQGCAGTNPAAPPSAACAIPNTVEVCIDDFDVANDTIVIDPKAVLVGSLVSTNLSGAPGCQSFPNDQDCISAMPKLGLDFTFDDGAGNIVAVGAESQKLFRKQ